MIAPQLLVDTSSLIEFLRGSDAGVPLRSYLTQRRAAVSAITVFELFAGVSSEKHRRRRTELVDLVRIIPVDGSIAGRAAELFTGLRRQGITIDNEDLIIAATAIEHDLAIYSGNVRHFESIPGVRLHIPE